MVVFAGIVSLLRPLVGSDVTWKLAEGVDTVNLLSRVMRQQPDQVVSEATKSPGLSSDDVIFLKQALANLSRLGGVAPSRTTSP